MVRQLSSLVKPILSPSCLEVKLANQQAILKISSHCAISHLFDFKCWKSTNLPISDVCRVDESLCKMRGSCQFNIPDLIGYPLGLDPLTLGDQG